jgi:transposase-like protein
MAGRPTIRLNVSKCTFEYIKSELEEYDAEQGAHETRPWRLKWDKARAILYAAEGGRTIKDIADLVGRHPNTVERWIDHFRAGGGDSEAMRHVLKVWRHRGSPMRRLEVLVPLLRAIVEGEVDQADPKGGAAWINRTLGPTYGIKMKPARAKYWLGHLPTIGRSKGRHLTDEELEYYILNGTELFPMWEAAKLKAIIGNLGVEP